MIEGLLKLNFLTKGCRRDEYAHISWSCTESKKATCQHIQLQWKSFLESLSVFVDVDDAEDTETVRLDHFEKVMVKNKHGEEKKHLKQISTCANFSFLVPFLTKTIPEIIHHRNELKHFRSVVGMFRLLFNAVCMDLDFSENLTIPMKDEQLFRAINQAHC